MKFKIRFADQIVGLFIIFALVSLAFVIVMLGRSQRWFAKDVSFTTVLPTAGGLSKNMAVYYKGFAIGSVTSFQLNDDDNVEVIFLINEEYRDRVKLGSMVELVASPIGLGNQFLFHAGLGQQELEAGSFIPIVGSHQGKELVRQHLAVEPQKSDLVASMIPQLPSILDGLQDILGEVQGILANLNTALGSGSSETEIGKMLASLNTTLTGVETLPSSLEGLLGGVIDDIMAEIKPLLETIDSIASSLDDPGGLLQAISPEVSNTLVDSLTALSGTLHNLEKTTAVLPAQFLGIMLDLRSVMKNADDVLASLTNNPLLRGGVPGRVESQSSNTNPRDIRF